ncbi:hypothetical protein A33M_0463 [Rhodovulum sp. PH10]|nr:hypothetical protein A33M_0463 [Rhodovulum sp. PH10]
MRRRPRPDPAELGRIRGGSDRFATAPAGAVRPGGTRKRRRARDAHERRRSSVRAAGAHLRPPICLRRR